MSEDRQVLVLYRIERAREALDAAHLLFERGHLRACVNRLYYACFYAASAVLLTKGLTATKHAGVVALFNRHYIKEGRLPKALGTTLSALFAARQEADYADLAQPETAEVERWSKSSGEFVNAVEAEVKSEKDGRLSR